MKSKNHRGFTLIELMVVVAIVAILLAIAIPSYEGYVLKSQIRKAQADLSALALNAENYLQRRLEYPNKTAGTAAASANKLLEMFPGWSPAESQNFTYTYTPKGAPVTGYDLAATYAGSSARLKDCVISMDSANAKTMSEQCRSVAGAVSW